MPQAQLKIRTRFQRMQAAYELAESLRSHGDPRVSNTAHEITTLLGAPITTLNNVIDGFEPKSKTIIGAMLINRPTPEARALDILRKKRLEAQT